MMNFFRKVNACLYYTVVLDMLARCYGVSGVGGSNPLVPTKNPLRTSLLRLVFLCLFSERGSFGELLGKKSVKCCLLIALEHND